MSLRVGAAASQKMKQEQNQADDQDNVNETRRYVKCEKSEQPEDDQNCGEYPKHFFISLLPGVRSSAA
jgi:hypothetical protein